MLRATIPPSVIWGDTVRMMPVFLYSMDCMSPVVPVTAVWVLWVAMGSSLPMLIEAFS